MSDLIDRQAAIDAISEYIHNVDKVLGTGHLTEDDCKDAATSIFEDLPSAQPEWIPCSERLPIGQTEVIASMHDDSGDTAFDYTASGWVTPDGEYWIVDGEINNFVVAWMPMPKAWKGEKDE